MMRIYFWRIMGVISGLSLALELGGQSLDSTFMEVDRLIEQSQFQAAQEQLSKLEVAGVDFHQRQAQVAIALGNSPRAIESYSALLSLDSTDVEALNALARLENQRSNYRAAFGYYQELQGLDSLNPYYLKKLGGLSLKRGSIASAFRYFEAAYQVNQQDLEVLSNLAKLYLEFKAYPQSDSLLQRGLALDRANVSLWMLDCQSAYRQKDYTRMNKALEALIDLQGDSSAFFLRNKGIASYHLGYHEASIQCLDRLVKQEGLSEIVAFYLGMAHRELGHSQESADYFNISIDEGISDQIGTYYLNLALSLEELDDLPGAIQAYQKSYRAKAQPVILYYLAVCYDAYYRDKTTAISYFEKFLEEVEPAASSYQVYARERISELKKQDHFRSARP